MIATTSPDDLMADARHAVYFVGRECFTWKDANLFGTHDGAEMPENVELRFVEDAASFWSYEALSRKDGIQLYDKIELFRPIPTAERSWALQRGRTALIVPPLPDEVPADCYLGSILPSLIEAAAAHAEMGGFAPLLVELQLTGLKMEGAFRIQKSGGSPITITVNSMRNESPIYKVNAALGYLLRGGLNDLFIDDLFVEYMKD